MINKNLTFGTNARNIMKDGINAYEDAVVSTLGPKGNRVIINKGTTYPMVTKDGVTVAREVHLKNKIQDAAISILREAAEKTNIMAGDGTTTSTLLACEIVKDGFKLLDKGYNANLLKPGIFKAQKDIIDELKKNKITINNEDEIRNIALVSSNEDEEIANLVTEAFCGIGDYGVVTNTDSFDERSFVKFSGGIELPKGLPSSVFITSRKTQSFEAEKPLIFLSYRKLEAPEHISSIVEWALSQKKGLVIIAPDYNEKVFTYIAEIALNGKPVVILKTPGFNKQTWDENIEDLGAAFNTPVANDKEVKVPDPAIYPDKLGTCESVKITANKAIFTGIDDTREGFKSYLNQLIKDFNDLSLDGTEGHTEHEKDKLKERIAKLSGGVATIYIGGVTSVELIEKKHRIEDATNAVRCALKEGVLPGGGVALYKIAGKLTAKAKIKDFKNTEEIEGYKLIISNCLKPFNKILTSMGYENTTIQNFLDKQRNKFNKNFFSGPSFENPSELKQVIDYYKVGIIDPYTVVEQSIINSISAANSLLSSNCIITDNISDSISVEANDPLAEMKDHYNEDL